MIDLHSHILPGVDDGASDWQESLLLARAYAEAGFRLVVATPHYMPVARDQPSPQQIVQYVAELNSRLKRARIDLNVFAGMEIAMDACIPTMLDKGLILPLGESNYLLIEPPFDRVPLGWEKLFFDIQQRGNRVIIAHPERCRQLAQHPQILEAMVSAGAYLQSNLSSLAGFHGSDCRRAASHLLGRGFVHCLATDSHDAKNRNAATIKSWMAGFHDEIGEGNLDLLCRSNPLRVLRNEKLTPMKAGILKHVPERRKRWRFW